MIIDVYTDGACSCNPGPGGYAFVIKAKGNNMNVRGYEENTTNNRMELTAIVKGLRQALAIMPFDKKREITIFSDSAYCINAMEQGWYLAWKSNGWKKRDGSKVKNQDLWEELSILLKRKRKFDIIKFEKVKGHSGIELNEFADKLARMAIKENRCKASSKG